MPLHAALSPKGPHGGYRMDGTRTEERQRMDVGAIGVSHSFQP